MLPQCPYCESYEYEVNYIYSDYRKKLLCLFCYSFYDYEIEENEIDYSEIRDTE